MTSGSLFKSGLVFAGLMSLIVIGRATDEQDGGRGKSQPLSNGEVARMRRSGSYKDGCPVSPEQLRLLTIPHWNFHKKIQIGVLVVQASVAEEALDIFQDLRRASFPIEKMRLIDEYEADDEASMRDNNTSAFNCRPITGTTGTFSKHSYGTAIDINPVQNPYLKIKNAAELSWDVDERQLPHQLTLFCQRLPDRCQILPAEGVRYLKRDRQAGVIVRGDAVHRAFSRRGWTWGGDWPSSRGTGLRTDYQHFEKVF